jgi:hypothetical protein
MEFRAFATKLIAPACLIGRCRWGSRFNSPPIASTYQRRVESRMSPLRSIRAFLLSTILTHAAYAIPGSSRAKGPIRKRLSAL